MPTHLRIVSTFVRTLGSWSGRRQRSRPGAPRRAGTKTGSPRSSASHGAPSQIGKPAVPNHAVRTAAGSTPSSVTHRNQTSPCKVPATPSSSPKWRGGWPNVTAPHSCPPRTCGGPAPIHRLPSHWAIGTRPARSGGSSLHQLPTPVGSDIRRPGTPTGPAPASGGHGMPGLPSVYPPQLRNYAGGRVLGGTAPPARATQRPAHARWRCRTPK